MAQPSVIIGISGASGAIYGIRMLEVLREAGVYTHAIISNNAKLTIAAETDYSLDQVKALAGEVHPVNDMAACISSGSHPSCGMIIAPCSMRSLGEIASGVTTTLITRSADVTLKERRKLVLMTRETPLHLGHIRNMAAATEMGAIIAPPVPAFYSKPSSLHDMIDHTIGRILDMFSEELNIEHNLVKRWSGMK